MVSALLQALIFIVSIKRHLRVAFVVMPTFERPYDISSHWPLGSLGIDPVTILQYWIRRCKSSNLILDFNFSGGRFSWGFSSSLEERLTPQARCNHVLPISIASKSFLVILYFSSTLCIYGGRREVEWRKTCSFTTATMTLAALRNVSPCSVQRYVSKYYPNTFMRLITFSLSLFYVQIDDYKIN
jgi:hypothetical protein